MPPNFMDIVGLRAILESPRRQYECVKKNAMLSGFHRCTEQASTCKSLLHACNTVANVAVGALSRSCSKQLSRVSSYQPRLDLLLLLASARLAGKMPRCFGTHLTQPNPTFNWWWWLEWWSWNEDPQKNTKRHATSAMYCMVDVEWGRLTSMRWYGITGTHGTAAHQCD